MNILIPIAGRDKYFKEDEYAFPKPLIDILGKPMIEYTVDCFKQFNFPVKFIFVVQDELCKTYSLDNVLKVICEGCDYEIIRLSYPTQGAVCSSLMAIENIDPEEELLISNSDHIFRVNVEHILNDFRMDDEDIGLVTFSSSHPRWSYVRTDETKKVVETSEKKVISKDAIAGLYYFKKGQEFIDAAKQVILNGVKVNNAFYISQVVNELILDGKKVKNKSIPSNAYFNLYSPQKVSEYEKIIRDERITKGNIDTTPVLIIPAAGEGSRFRDAGYDQPKPFIPVNGKTMIEKVLNNLNANQMRTTVIGRKDHFKTQPSAVNKIHFAGVKTLEIDQLTEGTACTILLANQDIDPDAPLIIANCDQLVDFDMTEFVNDCISRGLDGSILCFRDPTLDPKWSFAKMDREGKYVAEVKEKVAISDLATVGIYLFAKGSIFLNAAVEMIANNDRVNGEFYTCPIYNYAIAKGAKIGVFEIDQAAMHGIGTPDDLNAYIEKGINL